LAFFFLGPSLGFREGRLEAESAEVSSGVSVRLRLMEGTVVADEAMGGRGTFFLSAECDEEEPA
jgi:hypothetical protein